MRQKPLQDYSESPTQSHQLAKQQKNKQGKGFKGPKDQHQGPSEQVSWPKVDASLENTNTEIESHQTEQDKTIQELRIQIDQQNAELTELKQQLKESQRRDSHSPCKKLTSLQSFATQMVLPILYIKKAGDYRQDLDCVLHTDEPAKPRHCRSGPRHLTILGHHGFQWNVVAGEMKD